MIKRKVARKNTKSKASVSRKKKVSNGLYATEHDFIIIVGGGLVVLLLTVFMLFLT